MPFDCPSAGSQVVPYGQVLSLFAVLFLFYKCFVKLTATIFLIPSNRAAI